MKKAVFILLAACLIFSAAACEVKNRNKNPGDDFEVNVQLPFETAGTLKVGITNDGREEEMVKQLIREYNYVYPNVAVTYEKIPAPYNNTLVQMYGADSNRPGTMPDILMSNSVDMYPNINSGIFLNLQPYITAAAEKGLLDLDDFDKEMWRLGQKGYDGDQFLIPRSADRVVTHLNKAIFNACFADTADGDLPFTPRPGTKLPANGWTWTEFIDTCAALRAFYNRTDRSHLYLIDAYLNWEPVMYPIFRANGAEIIDAAGNVVVDKQETRAALDMFNLLISNRYAAGFDSATQANYEGGQGAMLFHSAPAAHYLASLGDEYDLTTFPLIGDTPKIGTGAAGYSVYSRSANRDLAWTFLQFILSEDGQESLAKGGNTVPPIRKDMQDPARFTWGRGFSDVNMAAYVFGTEYCIPTDFFVPYNSIQADLVDTLGALVKNAAKENANVNEAILRCKSDMEYYIGRIQ
ncbi:MAG: extracellular solute-binding protein [Clostridiales bacterium]|jgi:ABC-type glycerol-3-phosphate transport system substrate-binding protein|nr:extracellular solute-binding protein [Clostridiales bacterium]